jgi:Domain of unknown function (DUF4440)
VATHYREVNVKHRFSTGAAIGALVLASSAAVGDDLRDWIQGTTQSLYDAVARGDRAVWDRVLDSDCQITTEDGAVFDKAKFLEDMHPLPQGFSGQIRVRDLTTRRIGSAVVAHYWLDETENIFGQLLKTGYVETDVYRHAGATWKIVALQLTVVPRDLEPVPVSSKGWPALVGEYRFDDKATSHYQVSMRDGALYGGRDAGTATLLIPLAPLVFFQKGSIHIMVFVQDGTGAIIEVRELHKYNEVIMKRVAALRG